MSSLFSLLYTILFLSYVVTALFIVFHLLRYSLSRYSAILTTAFFLSVFGILLFTNVVIFFSLPLKNMFPQVIL